MNKLLFIQRVTDSPTVSLTIAVPEFVLKEALTQLTARKETGLWDIYDTREFILWEVLRQAVLGGVLVDETVEV